MGNVTIGGWNKLISVNQKASDLDVVTMRPNRRVDRVIGLVGVCIF